VVKANQAEIVPHAVVRDNWPMCTQVLMNSYKVVTPVKTGVQGIYKLLKILDSGFRRNDGKGHFQTFYEVIKF
jgi:hypothetical protein